MKNNQQSRLREYLIWCPDHGDDESNAMKVTAPNSQDAVEMWAKLHDAGSADWAEIAGGLPVDVCVKIDMEILRYGVRGQLIPRYQAHKIEKSTEL